MYTKKQLTAQLRKMKLSPDETLLVHSSFKAMGEVAGGAQTVLDALCEYLSEGLLLMPTHTWDSVGPDNPSFDARTTPGCTGVLGTLLLERPGAVRSLHPTHSLAAWGKDAAEFIKGEQYRSTPCPREGCMGRLLDRRGKVLFIGCPLSKNTFLHGVEEWAGIEHRLGEEYTCIITDASGSGFIGSMRSHRAPVPDVSLNYAKMEQPFLELGAAFEGALGEARCVLCDCARMTRITTELLILQPDLFLDDKPVDPALLKDLRISCAAYLA